MDEQILMQRAITHMVNGLNKLWLNHEFKLTGEDEQQDLFFVETDTRKEKLVAHGKKNIYYYLKGASDLDEISSDYKKFMEKAS